MSLGDPSWEILDPTPNVFNLFVQFDKTYFWSKLGNRAVVRWSKRMYSAAGICSYEGRGGLCDIALSEPLLKLRPRKDLVETLLHEMIHAFLFISGGDRDRDGHGPNFKSHMHRINKLAGLNISIYHDFHAEVKLYQTHWWRCNGACQNWHPYFGTVRRTSNRAPGPNDFWWKDHKKRCNGTFIKIKEPEKKQKKSTKNPKQNNVTKSINKTTKNTTINEINKVSKPKTAGNTKLNGSTVVITGTTKKTTPPKPINTIDLWVGKGHTVSTNKSDNDNVAETVRNIWANKQINASSKNNSNNKIISVDIEKANTKNNSDKSKNTGKRKSIDIVNGSPLAKNIKIDLTEENPKEPIPLKTITSIINNVYGEDFKLLEKNGTIYAVKNKDLVNCPICNISVKNYDINTHVDICLNRDVIANLTNDEVNYSASTSKDTSQIDIPSTSKNIAMPTELNNKEIDSNLTTIDLTESDEKQCPCCSKTITIPMNDHLEECLSFMYDNTTIPIEGDQVNVKAEVIDEDDDMFDDSQIFNETGTKFPCPYCLDMVELGDMNTHLDNCLQVKNE